MFCARSSCAEPTSCIWRPKLPRVAPAPDVKGDTAHGPYVVDETPTADEPPPEPRGCIGRALWRLTQQQECGTTLPLQLYSRPPQSMMAACCSIICMTLGVILLVDSSAAFEKVIAYDTGMTQEIFTLEQDLRDRAYLWYELPGMHVNQKRFVESRDEQIAGVFPTKYTCTDAETVQQVRSRRPGDDAFYALLENASFRPCGLTALAMFADQYELETINGTSVRLEQANLGLPGDEDIYDQAFSAHGPFLELGGERSWLRSGPPLHLFEHFKVWYRTPAAPFVRNLWAVIPAGLRKGQYRLRFVTNSAVWTGPWGLSEKRIVIGEAHPLGSVGARTFLGQMFVLLGTVEAVVALFFAVAPSSLGSLTQA